MPKPTAGLKIITRKLVIEGAAPTERSAERQALAEAIQHRDQAEAKVRAARAAVERAEDLVLEGQQRLEKARAELRASKERHSAKVAEAMHSGGKAPADSTMKAAKLALSDIEDEVETGRAALAKLESAIAPAELALVKATGLVTERAKLVLAAETTGLLAEAQQMMNEFRSRLAGLDWLLRTGVIDDAPPALNQPRHHDVYFRKGSPTIGLLQSLGFHGWAPTWLENLDREPGLLALQGALKALEQDADAPLPT